MRSLRPAYSILVVFGAFTLGCSSEDDGSSGNVGGSLGQGGTSNVSPSGGSSAGGATNGTAGTSSEPSDGCAQTDVVTGEQTLNLEVAGSAREVVLVVPETYQPGRAYPLIFAWHGLGGSGPLAQMYFGLGRTVGEEALILYPSGLPLESQDGDTGWDLAADGADVTLFDTLLAQISSGYCIDQNRIFSTGHSFGGMMTNALGCYRGGVLRAVAPVAGFPPFGNPTCEGEVAAFVVHGENDSVVDYTTGGLATRDRYLEANGCAETSQAVEPSPCVAHDGCTEGLPVHFCVHQDDHNWPDFAANGIWGFFSRL